MNDIRTGVYVCWCGTNIAKMVDVEKIAEELASLPNVVLSKNYKYMCSDPGQDMIIKDIKEHKLNRVVVAACSPRIHELTFRKALQNAGLNPYMFEMANIREQVSWVHTDREEATKKAKSLVSAAINKVAFHEPLEKRTVEINPSTLIIGGGIAGISAALEIADSGRKVFLIEKSSELGGNAAKVDLTFPYLSSAKQLIAPLIKRVVNHPEIDLFLNTDIKEIFGYIGNFKTTLSDDKGKDNELEFGNIIVATGLKAFDPSPISQYGYGKLNNVITSLEFEMMLKEGKILTREGTVPKNIAIIHCVGSRNADYHNYCSRVCCMSALKYANQIRSTLPATHIYQLYADMRAFGKGCEEFYAETSRKDVVFMMFDQRKDLPQINANEGNGAGMYIHFYELLSGEDIEVNADIIILMVGMEAQENAKEIAHAVGISMCGNEFYMEKHPKLDPVATTTDGVFIVGACQSPKDIPDSVSQAKAAAARILGTINRKTVEVEVTTAVVNEDVCCGCQTCVKVCPYTAISYIEDRKVSYVNEILCKGCGTCGSACPSGAIKSRHFTDQQILSQITGLMQMVLEEEL